VHIDSFPVKNSSQQSRASMTPGKNRASIAPRKREKSQGHYPHRYMVTRAILAKVCRCKPNRRSCEYPDFKQGTKPLKVNYFAADYIGVSDFRRSRYRTQSVTITIEGAPRLAVIEEEANDAELKAEGRRKSNELGAWSEDQRAPHDESLLWRLRDRIA
jgi:hypothetical protein